MKALFQVHIPATLSDQKTVNDFILARKRKLHL